MICSNPNFPADLPSTTRLTPTLRAAALAGTALMLGLATQPADALPLLVQAPYRDVYVIGDSLSDNGNLLALTHGAAPPAPYFQGRFSNGPVAVEVLATGLGAVLHDFAIGGAKTDTGGQLAGTGMTAQLAQYATLLNGSPADSSALYVVWGGANDLRAAGVNAAAAIAPTIFNLTSIVSSLYGLGARHFLLPNLPDLGLTPEALDLGATFASGASLASQAFNLNLGAAYGALAAALPDEQFTYFDAFAAQTALVAGVGSNGFTDVSHRCFNARFGSLCATPGTYLYWDSIHPTAAAHSLLGAQMLAAVPEPASMLLMSAGVLLLLGLGRGRRR